MPEPTTITSNSLPEGKGCPAETAANAEEVAVMPFGKIRLYNKCSVNTRRVLDALKPNTHFSSVSKREPLAYSSGVRMSTSSVCKPSQSAYCGAIAITKATQAKMTFEDYLNDDDGPEKRYEFVDGELVAMPPESPLNSRIGLFLLFQLERIFPEDQLCFQNTELAVSGTQVQVQVPDLMVLSPELAMLLGASNQGIILLEMPPMLVMEVGSPGAANAKRD
jgi:hypothetical protein